MAKSKILYLSFVKVLTLLFFFFPIFGNGQSPIPLSHYDLYSMVKGEKKIFVRDQPTVLQSVIDLKDELNQYDKDSLSQHFQHLYCELNLHFFNQNTLFWNTLSKNNDNWFTHVKGCAYQIDKETNRILISVPTSPGHSGNESYRYLISGDSLVLTPLTGTKGRIVYIKRKEIQFSKPWEQINPSIIIDAYGLNKIDWDKMIADSNVVAVIHKCSEGLRVDNGYTERKQAAKEHGYLWGSYHLGRAGDPIEQAQFYLSQIEDLKLISLDLEDVDNPKFMDLENALIFIDYVREQTGRYPILYCNNNVLNQINENYGHESSFAKCPLWYARFKSEVSDFSSVTWPTYTFWQFSCEINCEKTGECLYNVPGTAHDMDVNIFNGNQEELRQLWPISYSEY